MALTFPLSLAAFADRLVIEDGPFELQRFEEASGTSRGEIITRQIATPKWQAEIRLCPMALAEASALKALIERIGSAGQFYLPNPWRLFPADDPTGSRLGSSSPTIHTVGANNRSLRIGGLPSGYTLQPGDMLAFNRGSDPVRRSLHVLAEPATASGAGLTPLFEVEPHLRPGTATGLPVILRKPAAKMQITSFSPGRGHGRIVSGMAFTAIESF